MRLSSSAAGLAVICAAAASITDFAASTMRYQSTAFTLMMTLSRVMVSCCSAETVRVRMSTLTARSMLRGMIQ